MTSLNCVWGWCFGFFSCLFVLKNHSLFGFPRSSPAVRPQFSLSSPAVLPQFFFQQSAGGKIMGAGAKSSSLLLLLLALLLFAGTTNGQLGSNYFSLWSPTSGIVSSKNSWVFQSPNGYTLPTGFSTIDSNTLVVFVPWMTHPNPAFVSISFGIVNSNVVYPVFSGTYSSLPTNFLWGPEIYDYNRPIYDYDQISGNVSPFTSYSLRYSYQGTWEYFFSGTTSEWATNPFQYCFQGLSAYQDWYVGIYDEYGSGNTLDWEIRFYRTTFPPSRL